MKTISKTFFCIFVLVSASLVTFPQEDLPGSKDHPLFTRMPNYYISEYVETEFDSHEFYDGRKSVTVEGHKYVIHYYIKEGAQAPTMLQIQRNYINALKKIGGTVLYEGDREAWMKFEKNGFEAWVHIDPVNQGKDYVLTIVEKGQMVQEVAANADIFAKDISQTGHVAIYGIYFDTGKAEVKPESGPTLKEIARLLEQNRSLKLYVVGHTDNVGDFAFNMKLSQDRADTVVKVLVAQEKVDAGRLKAHGVGPLSPVASNKTEEGRAQNRRVELVER